MFKIKISRHLVRQFLLLATRIYIIIYIFITGLGTQDQYAIGDLSGKLQGRKEGVHSRDILPGSSKLSGLYWDTYLPLSGINSVVHRSIVVHK